MTALLEKNIQKLPYSLRFTKNSHIDYYDFASSVTLNKDLSQFLSIIDSIIMGTENTESLKITPLQSNLDLASKIGLEVVKSTMLETENIENQQPEKNIKELIQKHLNEILPNESDKELILKLFPEDGKLPLSSVLKEASNDSISKACGFPSSKIFRKFINQYDDTNNTLQIDVKYLISLLCQSENLSSDGFLNKYKENLKKYKMTKPGTNLDTLSQNNKKQLDRIRSMTIRNIDFFLKFSPKKAESLSSFAERNGKHWKKFSKKEINIFKKLLFSSSTEQETVLTNPSTYIPVFNCNLCESLAKPTKTTESNKKKKKNKYEFVTDWTAKIAIQKITPLWDQEGIKRHWEACHGPNAITHGSVIFSFYFFCDIHTSIIFTFKFFFFLHSVHNMILSCAICARNDDLYYSMSCCIPCAKQHHFL